MATAPLSTTDEALLERLIDLRERALRLGHATAYNHFDRRISGQRGLVADAVSA